MKRALVAAVFLSVLLVQSGHDVRADFVCSSSVLNVCSGGGGGASGITAGTTTISGGNDTRVLFNDGGVVGEDAGMTYVKGTDIFTVAEDIQAEAFSLEDSDASHRLRILTTSNLTDHRILTLVPGDAARTLTIFGDTTIPVATQQITLAGPTQARTYTFPDAAETVATLGQTQTFTGAKTIGTANWTLAQNISILGASNIGGFTFNRSNLTPDSTQYFTGTTGNSNHFLELGDASFDFNNGPCGTAACINPQWIVHDKDQNVTDYQSVGVSGLSGKFTTTLTESNATSTVIIGIAAEEGAAGEYTVQIYATDGSTPQVRYMRVTFAATNDGGTETCTLGTPEEIDHTPTGTLTATITCVDGGTNAIAIQVNAVSDLTQTTLEARSRVSLVAAGEALPQ